MVSGEKRNCDGDHVLEKVSALLLDVEGTTTSISFVKDTLFPYIRNNLEAFVDSHWNDDEFKEDLKLLKSQAKKDEESKLDNFCPIEEGEKEKESLIKNVLWQMDLDRKTTALKQLQGHIWREGYENGKLKGQVFSDVPTMFKKWCEDGRKLYIYSSGSVEAQKLLFKNAETEDLEVFITDHFDTEIGPKTEASSYTSIASKIGLESNEILFLTDSVKEAVAAEKAGLQVNLVVRDGNAPLTDDEKKAFSTIANFKELVFESSNKKKKICKEDQDVGKPDNGEFIEPEVKDNKIEKMEVESQEDCKEAEAASKEENEVDKLEENKKTERSVEESEMDSKVEKQESNVEAEVGDKMMVSSSVGETAEEPVQEPVNGAEGDDVKESINSTEETVRVDTEENGETQRENEGKTLVANEEPAIESEQTKSFANGHEREKLDVEVNTNEATVNLAEEIVAEPVVAKKVIPEEPADSTVEVTA